MELRCLVTVIVFLSEVWVSSSEFRFLREVCGSELSSCMTLYRSETPLSKREALRHCELRNETLATIDSVTADSVLSTRIPAQEEAWIGLNINPTIGRQWKWLHDGGWYDAIIAPSSINDDRGQSCLLVNRDKLYSVYCFRSLKFMCESSESPPNSDECDMGLERIGLRWICIRSLELTWVEAARFCAFKNSSLLIVESVDTLNQIRAILSDSGTHFWTAGTSVTTTWDDPHLTTNPYKLRWSGSVRPNPNLDEITRSGTSWCAALTSSGILNKRCRDGLTLAICSKPTEITTVTSSTSTTELDGLLPSDPSSVTFSTTTTTTASSSTTSSPVLSISITPPLLQLKHSGTSNPTSVSTVVEPISSIDSRQPDDMTSPVASGGSSETEDKYKNGSAITTISGVTANDTTNKYQAVVICAYILAVLFGIGLILLIALLIWRRRKRKLSRKEPVCKRVRSANGSTLTRKNTSPAEEWEIVLLENGERKSVLHANPEREIDIIHNVPLDPRATLDKPLNIPTQPQYFTLQRNTSRKSEDSNCTAPSEKGTFTERRSSQNSSPGSMSIAPPVPPKSEGAYLNHPDTPPDSLNNSNISGDTIFPLPPPPEELLINTKGHNAPPLPPKPAVSKKINHKPKKRQAPGHHPNSHHTPYNQPNQQLNYQLTNQQAVQAKPAARSKPYTPDPIYGQINKPERHLPPEPATSDTPRPPTRIPSSKDRTSPSAKSEKADSGVDMASPTPPAATEMSTQDQLAFLDEILAQFTEKTSST